MNIFRTLTLFAASASAFVAPSSSSSAYRRQVINHMGIVSSSTQRNMSSSTKSATDFAKQEIDNNKIVIFSKSYCPYCSSAKELFAKLNVDGTKIYELDTMDNGAAIQDALLKMTGQRTVPNIFINQKHVGGNDDVQGAYRSGKLQKLIDNVTE